LKYLNETSSKSLYEKKNQKKPLQADFNSKNVGLVHPKMKILSVFTHPQVVPNLYVFICSVEHKGRYLEECFNQTDLIPH